MEQNLFIGLIGAGLHTLWEYIVHHSVTYLLPAFLLAGAVSAFIPYVTIMKYLSSESRRLVSFSLATIKGMVLATCSTTVLPLVKVLYRKGYGIAPTFIILWTAPTMNLLALTYTEAVMGGYMAFWRLISALLIVPVIGVVMTAVLKEDRLHDVDEKSTLEGEEEIVFPEIRRSIILILLLIALLVIPNFVEAKGPSVVKYAMFSAIGSIVLVYSLSALERGDILKWLKETTWFVKRMAPLLLVGIFIAGVIGSSLPEDWIKRWLVRETLMSVLLVSVVMSLTYMPMLAEVPLANELVIHGTSKGIALIILLLGSGMSLPSIVVIGRLFGWRRSLAYFLTVLLCTIFIAYILGTTVF